MANYKGISPVAAVFRAYPDAFLNAPNAIVRVQSISSLDGDRRDKMARYVLEQIALLITKEKNRVDTHHREAQRRRQANKQDSELVGSENENLDGIFEDAGILDEGGDEGGDQPVRARNINFILVDDQATVRTRIFPRTFHCKNCGHFVALDPARPPAVLLCPCCHKGQLVQEPIVFGCAKCANVRELIPKGARLNAAAFRKTQNTKDFLGGAPSCPDCHEGHIHLEKHNTNSIQYWQWYCNQCKEYREDVQESCLNCYLPQGEDDKHPKQVVSMSAFPASASNAFKPLVDTQMFVRNEPLEPESLDAAAKEATENWPDYFELHQTASLTREQRAQIEQACIANAYLLNGVRVVTTVYGYRSGGIMARSPIEEDDRLARFFPDPEKLADYVCYGMMNEGAALVLQLDKKLIMERLAERYQHLNGLMFEQALSEERETLATIPLKNLLQPLDNRFPLIAALHGMEHALLATASRRIGNEVLGSKLFVAAGVLLLYEREPIGRGGAIQVVNGGPGLHALIVAAGDHVAGCAQGCVDGCPSCIYLPDTHCQYRSEELGRTWLPANTLLSRTGARQLLLPDLSL